MRIEGALFLRLPCAIVFAGPRKDLLSAFRAFDDRIELIEVRLEIRRPPLAMIIGDCDAVLVLDVEIGVAVEAKMLGEVGKALPLGCFRRRVSPQDRSACLASAAFFHSVWSSGGTESQESLDVYYYMH